MHHSEWGVGGSSGLGIPSKLAFSIPHSTIPKLPTQKMSAIQIVTTTPSRELAEQIAAKLVEERLAACVQVDGPIGSIYRWEGKVEQDEEWRLTAKTLDTRFVEVEGVIRGMHPYDVPEILAVPVSHGSAAYLQWLREQASE